MSHGYGARAAARGDDTVLRAAVERLRTDSIDLQPVTALPSEYSLFWREPGDAPPGAMQKMIDR